MLRIDGVAEVQAAALLYSRAPAEIRKGIQAEAKRWGPDLVRAAVRRAPDQVSRQIAASGRTRVTANGLEAVFGASGRLSSGAPLRSVARQWEFGTGQPEQVGKYLSRRNGKSVKVTRRVQRQVPRVQRKGRFIYPAVADCTPDLVSRWVRAVAGAVTYG